MNLTLGQKLFRTKSAERHIESHSGAEVGLQRSLGLFPLTMIGVGATIGTGIFFTMVEAVPKAGPAVILSFLLAALTASQAVPVTFNGLPRPSEGAASAR